MEITFIIMILAHIFIIGLIINISRETKQEKKLFNFELQNITKKQI